MSTIPESERLTIRELPMFLRFKWFCWRRKRVARFITRNNLSWNYDDAGRWSIFAAKEPSKAVAALLEDWRKL